MLPRWARGAPPSLDRTDARRRLGWPERGFIAVHTGALDPAHDPVDVLDAARLLGPGRLVVIVGDGPRRASVAERASGVAAVLVNEPLPADLAPLALVASDALLVTEQADTGLLPPPGEVADYLAAGRPVVAAVPVAGTVAAELSRSAGAGIVVPPGEPGRLAGALLALHADPGRRVGMGLAGLAYADAQLSLTAVLARFDAIVDAALSGAVAGPSPSPTAC
jgi:glycosyltransferase involved in cell wall biosynthesis